MAEDDIYGSKHKYERLKISLNSLLVEPSARKNAKGSHGKYICKNPENLNYFKALFAYFESKDISNIRRVRLLQSMRLICHLASKNLAACTREDINEIVSAMHNIYNTPKSKQTFIFDLKYFWRILFPEKDAQGRADETIVPYVVRHLSGKMDKSREKLRRDKLTYEEIERLVNYFSNEPRIQAYLTISLESLARPQELVYIRLRDIELYDNYAKMYIGEHGKEGVGLLQCIDSYPYLLKWLDVHPLKKDKDAFLFLNTGNANCMGQLKPQNINKLIRKACRDLQIEKPVTCYSLKRNGVTIRRLRGETDMEIQHAARWTSIKQLRTYDLTNQEEAFKRELEKRGIIPASDKGTLLIQRCAFCDKNAGFGEVICSQCKRPLDRSAILSEEKHNKTEIQQLKEHVSQLTDRLESIKAQLIPELMKEILENKNNNFISLQVREKASASILEDKEG